MPTLASARAEISFVICTRNRAESLRITPGRTARDDHHGRHMKIVVVDTRGTDRTVAGVETFAAAIPIRLLREAVAGEGSSHNRALKAGRLRAIVTVLGPSTPVPVRGAS